MHENKIFHYSSVYGIKYILFLHEIVHLTEDKPLPVVVNIEQGITFTQGIIFLVFNLAKNIFRNSRFK